MSDSKLRTDALAIFSASLKAVDPVIAVKKHVSREGDVLRVGDRNYNLSTRIFTWWDAGKRLRR